MAQPSLVSDIRVARRLLDNLVGLVTVDDDVDALEWTVAHLIRRLLAQQVQRMFTGFHDAW